MTSTMLEEFAKDLELLMSMCLNCKMGGISEETFVANLRVMLQAMETEVGDGWAERCRVQLEED